MKKLILIALLLSSCSPQWHFERAQKKGLIIDPVYETILKLDTIKGENGKDSIVYTPEHIVKFYPKYQTKWKTRFDNRRFNDSLKHYRTIYKDSLSYALRTTKNENKTEVKEKRIESNWKSFLIFGIFIGAIFSLIIKRVVK